MGTVQRIEKKGNATRLMAVRLKLEPGVVLLGSGVLDGAPIAHGRDSGRLVEGPVQFVVCQLVRQTESVPPAPVLEHERVHVDPLQVAREEGIDFEVIVGEDRRAERHATSCGWRR